MLCGRLPLHREPGFDGLEPSPAPFRRALARSGSGRVRGGRRDLGLVYLGRQYSALLRVREDHALIDGGPYAWVRHPMYSFGVPFLMGLGIMTANWFIF